MDEILLGYFFCISIPLAITLFLLDTRSRITVLFVIIGAMQYMYSETLSGVLYYAFGEPDTDYMMSTFVPLVFELSKAIPIAFYAIVVSRDRKIMLTLAAAEGSGFAILESLYALSSEGNPGLILFLTQILICVLINIICTCLLGIGISYSIKKLRYFLCSFPGFFSLAALLHGLIIMLFETNNYFVGAVICILIYVPMILIITGAEKKKRIQLRM